MIRLTYPLRRKPGMSTADFQEYWRTIHGPLVARHATTLNILRYVQVHTLDDPANQELSRPRGKMESPYDGVAELWWTNREALAAVTGAAGQAARELLEDETKFIDLPNSPLWLAYEYPQVNPVPEELVACEHSSLVEVVLLSAASIEPDTGAGPALLAHQPRSDYSRRCGSPAHAALFTGPPFRGRFGTRAAGESRDSGPRRTRGMRKHGSTALTSP